MNLKRALINDVEYNCFPRLTELYKQMIFDKEYFELAEFCRTIYQIFRNPYRANVCNEYFIAGMEKTTLNFEEQSECIIKGRERGERETLFMRGGLNYIETEAGEKILLH